MYVETVSVIIAVCLELECLNRIRVGAKSQRDERQKCDGRQTDGMQTGFTMQNVASTL
jgi:hypothetical protein